LDLPVDCDAGVSRRPPRRRRFKSRHPLVVLGQAIVDLPPRRLGSDEHVKHRTHLRVVVQKSGVNEVDVAVLELELKRGFAAAHAAERAAAGVDSGKS
jgi:hypothetical protein